MTVIWMVTVVPVCSTISADMIGLLRVLGRTEEFTITHRAANVYINYRSHPGITKRGNIFRSELILDVPVAVHGPNHLHSYSVVLLA